MPTLKRLLSRTHYLVIPAVLIVISIWLYYTPPGLLGKADGIGYAVCHRISERSFHIDGRQLPLCARCSGMYLGAVIGLIFQGLTSPKREKFPPWSISIPLLLFLAAFAVDGTNSYLYLIKSIYPGELTQIPNLYVPNNFLRLFTGAGMGLGLAAIIFPAFNQTAWADAIDQPSLSWKTFPILIGITTVGNLLVLTESPIILFTTALISSLGVIVLLTLVYAIIWIMLMQKDNQYRLLRQLWLALLTGVTVAFLQVLAIDLLRLWLTGTWGAIPLN